MIDVWLDSAGGLPQIQTSERIRTRINFGSCSSWPDFLYESLHTFFLLGWVIDNAKARCVTSTIGSSTPCGVSAWWTPGLLVRFEQRIFECQLGCNLRNTISCDFGCVHSASVT